MSNFDFTPERRALFLQVLADTCSPKQACAVVGIARSSAYHHREKDLEFAAQWDAAVAEALDAVLEESYRRAVVGVNEPVVYQGDISKDADGKPVTVTKYSDRLLELLMKWRYPEQMADRLRVRSDGSGLDSRALLAMSPEERTQLVALLSKYAEALPEQTEDEDAAA